MLRNSSQKTSLTCLNYDCYCDRQSQLRNIDLKLLNELANCAIRRKDSSRKWNVNKTWLVLSQNRGHELKKIFSLSYSE